MIDAIANALMYILNMINGVTGSYAWSLIILAGLIKLVFFGPTQKQYQTMKDMQMIQPEIKKLQELYKNEPEKLQKEQLLLFRKHKINPLGGCLPMLIQLPVLWAIWTVIRSHTEVFKGSGFLWIGSPLSHQYPQYFGTSLAVADIPLLLLYGYSMYLTSKMSATDTQTSSQQFIFTLVLPVVFTYMMYKWNLPCALVLYWLVYNLMSIIHQSYMMRQPSGVKVVSSVPEETTGTIKKKFRYKKRRKAE